MSRTSRAFGQAAVLGIALSVVGGLSGVARGQGAGGGGELLELLARAFMAAEAERVNINTAPAAELEKRLGIQGATARRIVAGRPYASLADLTRAGIPAGTIQKIVPLATAGPMPGSGSATLAHRGPAQAAPADRDAVARGRVFQDILFDFGASDVRAAEADKIKEIAELMKRKPSLMARLDGFADPRGTGPYNLGLSDRRVKAVVDALVARGVAAPRVQIAAMGEKNRNCPEATEECYQKNRRVHFSGQ